MTDQTSWVCAICLNTACATTTCATTVCETKNAIVGLPCGHAFHQHCWFRFLIYSNYPIRCPMCRRNVAPSPDNQFISASTLLSMEENAEHDHPPHQANENTVGGEDDFVYAPNPDLIRDVMNIMTPFLRW